MIQYLVMLLCYKKSCMYKITQRHLCSRFCTHCRLKSSSSPGWWHRRIITVFTWPASDTDCFAAMVTLIVQVHWSYRSEDRSINQLWVTFWSRLVWLPDRQTDWPPGGTGTQHTGLGPVTSTRQRRSYWQKTYTNTIWVEEWGHWVF